MPSAGPATQSSCWGREAGGGEVVRDGFSGSLWELVDLLNDAQTPDSDVF